MLHSVKLSLFALCIFVVLLVGCTSQPTTAFENMDILIAEGVIATFNLEYAAPQALNLTQVKRGDIVQLQAFPINVVFPQTYHLHFSVETFNGDNSAITPLARDYGYFSGVDLEEGQIVNAGDFIAELTFEVPETIAIARHALALERRQFEGEFEAEQQRRRQEMEALQVSIGASIGRASEMYSLRLNRAELSYAQFVINGENSRQSFDNRLLQIDAPIQTERLYAPISGRITWLTPNASPRYMRDFGVTRLAGRRVVSIRNDEEMQFIVHVPIHALRFGDVIQVGQAAGEAYFYANVVTDVFTQNMIREGNHDVRLAPAEGEWERFIEAVKEEQGADFDLGHFLDNLALRARTVTYWVTDGILVERSAIRTELGREFVMLYEDGDLSRRYVITGFNGHIEVPRDDGDGYRRVQVVQILSGLNPGQWVAIP